MWHSQYVNGGKSRFKWEKTDEIRLSTPGKVMKRSTLLRFETVIWSVFLSQNGEPSPHEDVWPSKGSQVEEISCTKGVLGRGRLEYWRDQESETFRTVGRRGSSSLSGGMVVGTHQSIESGRDVRRKGLGRPRLKTDYTDRVVVSLKRC